MPAVYDFIERVLFFHKSRFTDYDESYLPIYISAQQRPYYNIFDIDYCGQPVSLVGVSDYHIRARCTRRTQSRHDRRIGIIILPTRRYAYITKSATTRLIGENDVSVCGHSAGKISFLRGPESDGVRYNRATDGRTSSSSSPRCQPRSPPHVN